MVRIRGQSATNACVAPFAGEIDIIGGSTTVFNIRKVGHDVLTRPVELDIVDESIGEYRPYEGGRRFEHGYSAGKDTYSIREQSPGHLLAGAVDPIDAVEGSTDCNLISSRVRTCYITLLDVIIEWWQPIPGRCMNKDAVDWRRLPGATERRRVTHRDYLAAQRAASYGAGQKCSIAKH